jgi:hypothetical protein
MFNKLETNAVQEEILDRYINKYTSVYGEKIRETCRAAEIRQSITDQSVIASPQDCPLMDKAFTCQKRGKVLGVKFDTTDLTWSLSDKKIQNALGSVKMAVTNDNISLKECQRLVGRLNDVGQLCPLMKVFKQPTSQCLATIPSNADPGTRVEISAEAKDDLLVWAGFLSSEFRWLPINR